MVCGLDKNKLFVTQVEICGQVLNNGTGRPAPGAMRALELWERPQTITQLRSFLGVCNYYHIYIRNYAHLAGPLQELLKVGKQEGKKGSRVKVNWQQVHQHSFNDLKKAVLNIRALNLHTPDAPIYLRCDASDWAVGCTLEQYDPKAHKVFPVAFWSEKLAPGQNKWSPREKGAYAIVEALRKYQTWIGNNPVPVVTDHKSLDDVSCVLSCVLSGFYSEENLVP